MASVAKIKFTLISLVCAASFTSSFGYYTYHTDSFLDTHEFSPSQVRSLVKRQADKDQSKQSVLNKETKTQSDQNLQNSSQGKLTQTDLLGKLSQDGTALNSSNVPVAVSDTIEDLNVTAPNVDYDGQSVNISQRLEDHHQYYNSSLFLNPDEGMRYWVDLESVGSDKVVTHQMLSDSHRRAATIRLSFDFPFYGHLVRNVTIATGGFLYTGDYVHSWLAATQYIAPLMANFDTSLSNDSTIKYWDNGTALTVQWDKVVLQDRKDAGRFTFQAILRKNGDVVFVYKDMPLSATSIGDEAHPVKVGLSDAYVIERTIFFMRRKTIYEYHQVNMKKDDITNGSAIYFAALPSCVSLTDCNSCISNTINFKCVWCPRVGRCSDGTDRYRQDWIINECDKNFIDQVASCAAANATAAPSTTTAAIPTKSSKPASSDEFTFPSSSSANVLTNPTTTPLPVQTNKTPPAVIPSTSKSLSEDGGKAETRVVADEMKDNPESGTSASAVVGILFFVALVVAVTGWIFYAYRNPHTPSGQFLIRYRPSGWRWRSGEAHYTAAAIHM